MNRYFETLINILGVIVAITTSLLENCSLEIKLLTFIVIFFIAILISYIYSTVKCHKLIAQNNNLIEENNNLKEQLAQSNQKISIQESQLNSYIHSNDDDENRKITII